MLPALQRCLVADELADFFLKLVLLDFEFAVFAREAVALIFEAVNLFLEFPYSLFVGFAFLLRPAIFGFWLFVRLGRKL